MLNAMRQKTTNPMEFTNDNYCAATLQVSNCGRPVSTGAWGEAGGCVFKVGEDMYFVPTQHVADEDMLYITCDAQKIEGPLEGWRTRLALGDMADQSIEDAILGHLHKAPRVKQQGEAFVITRDGKTFRL